MVSRFHFNAPLFSEAPFPQSSPVRRRILSCTIRIVKLGA